MNLSSLGSSIATPLSRYSAASSDRAATAKQAGESATAGTRSTLKTGSDQVQLSAEAITASDAQASPLTTAQSARAKVNADYVKAKVEGTQIVADIANGGRFLNLTSLNDEELASVAKGDGFTDNESLTAKVELGVRLKVALGPFDGNPRATAVAIKAMYPALSQSVKDAMGWNQSMLEMGDRIINDAGGAPRPSELDNLLDRLRQTQKQKGALRIDLSVVQPAPQRPTIDRLA
ncbi:hypothetical protein [Sphingomonas sp. PAMC 26621]|uniref:hypothetical protein n=1 Tax=Sphingomonas sp. PAMC 26621 TaxID=1112213 RepID=UPI000287BF00|nr:hypothetical protein [Sphingomonas sp. PAMC 26621]